MRYAAGMCAWALVVAYIAGCRGSSAAASGPFPGLQVVETRLPAGGVSVGDSTASVALLEYGPFACPVCRRFAVEVFPELEARFIRSRRVRYRYVDLSPSGPPLRAAALAECTVSWWD